LKSGSEELRGAVGGDDHVIFAADAECADDVDAGLVRKSHAGRENGFAAAHEIGMLVAIEADAVAEAVGEIFVPGSEASGRDDITRRIVNGAG